MIQKAVMACCWEPKMSKKPLAQTKPIFLIGKFTDKSVEFLMQMRKWMNPSASGALDCLTADLKRSLYLWNFRKGGLGSVKDCHDCAIRLPLDCTFSHWTQPFFKSSLIMQEPKLKPTAVIRQLDKLAIGLVGCAAIAYVAAYGFVSPFEKSAPDPKATSKSH